MQPHSPPAVSLDVTSVRRGPIRRKQLNLDSIGANISTPSSPSSSPNKSPILPFKETITTIHPNGDNNIDVTVSGNTNNVPSTPTRQLSSPFSPMKMGSHSSLLTHHNLITSRSGFHSGMGVAVRTHHNQTAMNQPSHLNYLHHERNSSTGSSSSSRTHITLPSPSISTSFTATTTALGTMAMPPRSPTTTTVTTSTSPRGSTNSLGAINKARKWFAETKAYFEENSDPSHMVHVPSSSDTHLNDPDLIEFINARSSRMKLDIDFYKRELRKLQAERDRLITQRNDSVIKLPSPVYMTKWEAQTSTSRERLIREKLESVERIASNVDETVKSNHFTKVKALTGELAIHLTRVHLLESQLRWLGVEPITVQDPTCILDTMDTVPREWLNIDERKETLTELNSKIDTDYAQWLVHVHETEAQVRFRAAQIRAVMASKGKLHNNNKSTTATSVKDSKNKNNMYSTENMLGSLVQVLELSKPPDDNQSVQPTSEQRNGTIQTDHNNDKVTITPHFSDGTSSLSLRGIVSKPLPIPPSGNKPISNYQSKSKPTSSLSDTQVFIPSSTIANDLSISEKPQLTTHQTKNSDSKTNITSNVDKNSFTPTAELKNTEMRIQQSDSVVGSVLHSLNMNQLLTHTSSITSTPTLNVGRVLDPITTSICVKDDSHHDSGVINLDQDVLDMLACFD